MAHTWIGLDEATAQLRELGDEAGLATARWLVARLDEPGEMRLAEPRRRCDCRRFEITSAARRRDDGCLCERTALALRLWERAFPDRPPGEAGEARKARHEFKCPACRRPFVTKVKAQTYCSACTSRQKGAA